jgi:hypothetical protein
MRNEEQTDEGGNYRRPDKSTITVMRRDQKANKNGGWFPRFEEHESNDRNTLPFRRSRCHDCRLNQKRFPFEAVVNMDEL